MRDPVLVTGAAGFIGFHMAERLLSQGRRVIGLDIVNSYYDPRFKESRLEILRRHSNFAFAKLDLTDRTAIKSLFEQHRDQADGRAIVLALVADLQLLHEIHLRAVLALADVAAQFKGLLERQETRRAIAGRLCHPQQNDVAS